MSARVRGLPSTRAPAFTGSILFRHIPYAPNDVLCLRTMRCGSSQHSSTFHVAIDWSHLTTWRWHLQGCMLSPEPTRRQAWLLV